MCGTSFMTPTSGHAKPAPVATPLVNAPAVPLTAGACPDAGSTSVVLNATDSGVLSRPKLGVVAPPDSIAVTVAVNDWPAVANTVPLAVLAAGFAKPSLLRLILDTTKFAGTDTIVPVLPRMPVASDGLPVVSSFIEMARLPASLYFAVTVACPLVKVTLCATALASRLAIVVPLIAGVNVPVVGFTYPDQNFRLLAPV